MNPLFSFLRSRQNAFTILEMIAGMVIASLVVLLGFYGLQLIQLQYSTLKKSNEAGESVQRAVALLSTDFFKSEEVLLTSDSTLIFDYGLENVHIHLGDSSMVRIYGTAGIAFADTFNIRATIDSTRTYRGKSSQLLVQGLWISFCADGAVISSHFHKIYSAEQYLAH